ncbi:MAG: hypothetical protein JRG97_11065 [Deltaproteobacteria bacterium]|nr:hypothetical protein [Deltaproteobacteria bacterium]MBW2323034.1 hypothetical protein [Deltaproteobacteria bacterium]
MLVENAFAGIVLTAQSFNPSIFTETWLDKNGILAADSLEGMRVFSPEVAQFQTKECQVLVIPPKMQITFRIHQVSGDFEVQCNIAVRTVELLSHTPYEALGLNFDFFVSFPDEKDFNAYNRALLGTGDYQLLQEFSSADAKFGRYFSKDHGAARLKLDIKPVKGGPQNKDLLQFSFNFHHDVAQMDLSERAKRLIEFIRGWSSLREYSERLVKMGTTLKPEEAT